MTLGAYGRMTLDEARNRTTERVGARLPPDGNPCRLVSRFPERRRERFLSAEELGTLGDTLLAAEGKEHPSALLAVRLLILTGARRSGDSSTSSLRFL